jgi:hypothetical protein
LNCSAWTLCVPRTASALIRGTPNGQPALIALLCFVLEVLAAPFKSKSRLEAENAALRHQMVVLRRMVHRRVRLTNNDRLFFIRLYRWFPSILQILTIIRPETLVRWHQAGFRRYWRWKSRALGRRPNAAISSVRQKLSTVAAVAAVRDLTLDPTRWRLPF